MRFLSWLLAGVAVAAFGFTGGVLALGLIQPAPDAFVMPEPEAVVQTKLETTVDAPTIWPAVFGVVPTMAEPVEIVAEPEPEVVEEPPQENTTYFLTGLVAGRGSSSWAMISENDRGLVVRVGDTLVGGETVTAITAEGVWLSYEGNKELIPVQKSDLTSLVKFERREPAVNSPTEGTVEVTVIMESLDRRFIEEIFAEAGELSLADNGIEVITIRNGQLFEQMGLRAGDTIVSLNGKNRTSRDLISDFSDADVLGGALQFEILRGGSRQTVRVKLDQG